MKINLYPTLSSQNLSDYDIVQKLIEECVELSYAISSKTNVDEEVFDVLQMCVNIINKYKIDVNKSNLKHQAKLLKRGHNFIKRRW